MARGFADNMAVMGQTISSFLERCANGPLVLDRFGKEWATILAALKSRISAEEKVLYPLFKRGPGGTR